MRHCSFCGAVCDSQIGIARKLETQYWGGKTGQKVDYSPKVVSFFCSENHRQDFLSSGMTAGEVQTRRWEDDQDRI